MSDARPECRARATGVNCVIPADVVTGWCPRHDPAQADARRVQALQAAKTSHAPRALKLFGPEWSDPDFSTPEARVRFREAVAGARGRGELDDKAAATLLNACTGAMQDDPAPKGKAPGGPIVVEVARFDTPNGVTS